MEEPLLLVAGRLTVRAEGIASESKLPPASDEDLFGAYDPAAFTVRFAPLPRELDDALEAFLSDDILVDAFDGQLVGRLTDGLRAEAAEYRRRVTAWELGR